MVIPTLFSMMLVLASTNEIKVPASFHGSEAFFDFRKSGHELLAEKLLDSDGDGLLEALVVSNLSDGASGFRPAPW
jgi:hypothetical protein